MLHLLNYRVSIGRDNGGKVEKVANIAVHLRVPSGKKVKEVRLYTPDKEQSTNLKFQQSGTTFTFTIPALWVYAVCEVTFSNKG